MIFLRSEKGSSIEEDVTPKKESPPQEEESDLRERLKLCEEKLKQKDDMLIVSAPFLSKIFP